jgi:N-acetyl-anhydromuramoyl-L-alanine amidase
MRQTDPSGASLTIGADGWCPQAVREPSPNCDARPAGTTIDLLVIHNISLPPGRFGGPFIADLFGNRLDCDADPSFDDLRALRVSSHFLIRRDGVLMQFVSAADRAWHAGVSCFGERTGCNDFSIGVELEGTDFEPFAEAQYRVLADLTRALSGRYPLRDVAGREHIAPGRKTDPGPFFDWDHYGRLLGEPPFALSHATLRLSGHKK